MDQAQQLLRKVFQDHKPREIITITVFGDIIFKTADAYRFLQIYINNNNAQKAYRYNFELYTIARDETEYQDFLEGRDTMQQYQKLMCRNNLYHEISRAKICNTQEVYVADKDYYYGANLDDFNVRPLHEVYETILTTHTFNEDTLCQLTSIDQLEETPHFYVQKLYWGYDTGRDATGLYDSTNLQNLSVWQEIGTYLNENIQKLQHLSVLSVTNMHEVPEAFLDHIHTLANLISLSIGTHTEVAQPLFHRLEQLPPHLNQLEQLKYLDLSGNQLTGLGAITKLGNLRTLKLSENQLTNLEGLESLQELKELDLSGNNLTQLPKALAQLPKLRKLNLAKNQLKTIPDWLGSCTTLEELNLEQTQLETLPESIATIPGLKILNLKKNPFTALPHTMVQLPKSVVKIALRNAALYDKKVKEQMAQYPTGTHLFEADFNFKLMVIQQLMYVEEVLLPKFNIREFAKNYTQRTIDIEEEGYAPIPEAIDYFKKLPIPMELLIDIEELLPDGGDEIYGQIIPFWDGETEDFMVENLADIAYLPRLKRTNTMNFDKAQVKALRARKIKVSTY